jgi:chitinase
MITTRADVAINRFYAAFDGFITAEEMKNALEKARQEMKALQPGFTMISDISTFKPASPEAAEYLKEAAIMAKEAGVGRVVRVVSGSQIAAMQLNRMTKEAYTADVVASLEEAERLLAE